MARGAEQGAGPVTLETQFTDPVKPEFLRARQHVPGPVPRAAVASVEPVARWADVGEGRLDMALTVKGQTSLTRWVLA